MHLLRLPGTTAPVSVAAACTSASPGCLPPCHVAACSCTTRWSRTQAAGEGLLARGGSGQQCPQLAHATHLHQNIRK